MTDRDANLGEPGYFAHPTAVVDDGATIGRGTKIWHFSHIYGKARIGQHCSIGQNVVVANNAIIGDGCKVQNNVSVYEGVVLEDYVFCGPSIVFTNVITPRALYPRNTSSDYHTTLVKRGASIGANATIMCGITLGENALVGAGAVVTRNVAQHAIVYGNPARQHGWACACGLALTLDGANARCAGCNNQYTVTDAGLLVRSD